MGQGLGGLGGGLNMGTADGVVIAGMWRWRRVWGRQMVIEGHVMC